jgi:uncharacterized protein (TIGR01777 family)
MHRLPVRTDGLKNFGIKLRLLNIKKTILITGGTGLIGRHLCKKLAERGYCIALLSRNINSSSHFPVFQWDMSAKQIDLKAFQNVDCIIHLAGAGISDKRWTKKRKQEIIDSRVNSARIILEGVKKLEIKPESFISSSATGYYGSISSDNTFNETDPPADDFLGNICRQWEEEADSFEEMGIRSVRIRTGIVLAPQGGALPKMTGPVKYGISPVFGTGRQYLPWIHVEDLCNLYIRAVEDVTFRGAYNAVAPEFVTNIGFMREVAKALGKPFIPFRIPSLLLKAAMGEMASILLTGSRISSEKIRMAGFDFRFPTLEKALEDILDQHKPSALR